MKKDILTIILVGIFALFLVGILSFNILGSVANSGRFILTFVLLAIGTVFIHRNL